jgi:hypothetical protein
MYPTHHETRAMKLMKRTFDLRPAFSAAAADEAEAFERFICRFPGRLGDNVPSKSERSESSDEDSAKGNLPNASSISEMPVDHTSDLTVYWAPWIRSG